MNVVGKAKKHHHHKTPKHKSTDAMMSHEGSSAEVSVCSSKCCISRSTRGSPQAAKDAERPDKVVEGIGGHVLRGR